MGDEVLVEDHVDALFNTWAQLVEGKKGEGSHKEKTVKRKGRKGR